MLTASASDCVLSAPRHRGLAISERKLLLAVMDVAMVGAAYVVAFNLHTAPVRQVGFYVPRLGTVVVAAVWLLSAHLAGAYDLRSAATVRAGIRRVSTAMAFAAAALLVFFFLDPYQLTRSTLVLWVPLAWSGVMADRTLYARVFAAGHFAGRVVLAMPRHALETVWPEVGRQVGGLYRVVAVVDPERPDAPDRLRTMVAQRDVDEIVVGVRDDMSRAFFTSMLSCHEAGIRVRSLADLYEELTGRLLLDQLGHTWLMALPMRSETSRVYAAFKRGVDIVAATGALLVLGGLLVPLTPLMMLDDRGPLFHRQVRVGQYGRPFTILKLRTMRHRTDASLHWTEEGDRRITRVGRVLRRLHLDELPQAWSILKGDMSLVGPRPEQPHYVDELRKEIDFYNTRHTVRPGLTGWAQVNHGYASGVNGARVKLSYDLYYIKRQAPSLDLLIAARTLLAVLSLGGR